MPKETVEEFLKRGGKVTQLPPSKHRLLGSKDADDVIEQAKKKYRVIRREVAGIKSKGPYVWANREMAITGRDKQKNAIRSNIKRNTKKGLFGLGLTLASFYSSIKEAQKK